MHRLYAEIQRFVRKRMAGHSDAGTKRCRKIARQRLLDMDLIIAALGERAGTEADLNVFLGQFPWAKALGHVDVREKLLGLQMSREMWILLAQRVEFEMSREFRDKNSHTKPMASPGHVVLARVKMWAKAQPGWARLDLAQRTRRC